MRTWGRQNEWIWAVRIAVFIAATAVVLGCGSPATVSVGESSAEPGSGESSEAAAAVESEAGIAEEARGEIALAQEGLEAVGAEPAAASPEAAEAPAEPPAAVAEPPAAVAEPPAPVAEPAESPASSSEPVAEPEEPGDAPPPEESQPADDAAAAEEAETPTEPAAAEPEDVDWEGSAQKWVPIFSLESRGVYLGAAQVAGPVGQVAKVKGVAELRLRFKDLGRIYAYIPVSTISLTKLDRVQGVSVWATGDLELVDF